MQDKIFSYHLKDILLVFLICCSVWVLLYIAARIIKPNSKSKAVIIKIMDVLLLCAWIYVTLYVTLLSRDVTTDRHAALISLETTMKMLHNRIFLKEKILNVILFTPLGLFIPCVLPKRLPDKGFVTVICCCAVSSYIEYAQYKYKLGTADIYDIICNTAGGVAGYCIFALAAIIVYIVGKVKMQKIKKTNVI